MPWRARIPRPTGRTLPELGTPAIVARTSPLRTKTMPPATVLITEEGPREGFQIEPAPIATSRVYPSGAFLKRDINRMPEQHPAAREGARA
jgi:hypothetical protein